MKTARKKSHDENHFDDEFLKKPVKKMEPKRDRKKPRIYELEEDDELLDFDDLLDEGLDFPEEDENER